LSTVPEIAPEAEIAAAVGIAAELTFHSEGGPRDEVPADAKDDVHLGLDAAVRRAVLTDPGIQSALAHVRVAMADAEQARTLPNPILGFIYRWGPGTPVIEATLSESILGVLQRPRRASAADHKLRQAAADALTVALDAVAELQEQYADAQTADQLVPLLEERSSLLRRLGVCATGCP
jgi:outer membrane protein TolC